MNKVVNPCKCEVYSRYGNRMANAYAEITFRDGKLSIHGVVGPMSSGNCKGSCGQCVDEIRNGEPVDGWTAEMLHKFCGIWDEWHLNDMRPYCQHQKELGWRELAHKEVTLYHYRLCTEVTNAQRRIKREALEVLKAGKAVQLLPEEQMWMNLEYAITSHTEELPEKIESYYEPKKPLYAGDKGATEVKTLGWLRPEEHPEGILTKPCPVCGYKYGSAWLKEEVPADVIDWLFSLPDTKTTPAWV